MSDRCKENVYRYETRLSTACTRKAIVRGYCKQHALARGIALPDENPAPIYVVTTREHPLEFPLELRVVSIPVLKRTNKKVWIDPSYDKYTGHRRVLDAQLTFSNPAEAVAAKVRDLETERERLDKQMEQLVRNLEATKRLLETHTSTGLEVK